MAARILASASTCHEWYGSEMNARFLSTRPAKASIGAPQARSPFGMQLRQWRARRGWSQAQLAHEAGTTARHVSFVESGRSRPGANLVLRLARALDLPIRERNELCAAAGLPAAYPTHALTDAALSPIRNVVDQMLEGHEPFPAWLIGPGFRFLATNRTAGALMPGLCDLSQEAAIDFLFGPGAFRDRVENWHDVAQAGLDLLHREAARYDDPGLDALLRRAQALMRTVAMPVGASRCPVDMPVICPRFKFGERVVRTIGVVMRFDTAVEQTTSELRLELMFPADADAEKFFREQAIAVPVAK